MALKQIPTNFQYILWNLKQIPIESISVITNKMGIIRICMIFINTAKICITMKMQKLTIDANCEIKPKMIYKMQYYAVKKDKQIL